MKSKKILTILLSLAIMFTFMPAMAFAATEYVAAGSVANWSVNDFYATLKDSNNHDFKAVHVFGEQLNNVDATTDPTDLTENYTSWKATTTGTWSGMIGAVVFDDTSVNGKVFYRPVKKNTDGSLSTDPDFMRYFFDLNGSSLVYTTDGGATFKALDKSSWTKTSFDDAVADGNIYLELVKQNYTNDSTYKVAEAKKAHIKLNESSTAGMYTAELKMNGNPSSTTVWTLSFKLSNYDSESATTEQTLTFSYEGPDANGAVTDGLARQSAELIGVVPNASVTIAASAAAKPATTDDGKTLFMDKVNNTLGKAAYYDGAAHTIVAKEFAGYTVAYGIYNKTTGKYDAAPNGVTLTDVGTVKFSVTFTNPTTKDKVEWKDLTAEITAVNDYNGAWGFGFKSTGKDATDYYAAYKVEGSEYNVADYLDVAAVSDTSDAQKAVAGAVAANKTELMSFFNDYFEVKASSDKFTPNDVTLTIVGKADLFKTENAKAKKALDEKYAKLIKNFGIDVTTSDSLKVACVQAANNDNVSKEATLTLNYKGIDDQITFTKAISSKTYKGSKTTKKGKLKKNQTIQFTAEAPNGTPVKYKLINVNTSKITIDSKTGKVTLKKGLAKGTYKFKVKAYEPGWGQENYEVQNVTIKVKK